MRKFNEMEMMLLANIAHFDSSIIMEENGDIKSPVIEFPMFGEYPDDIVAAIEDYDSIFATTFPRKNMKAADRRKRTYHKQQQRENKYRNLGYSLERFSKSDLGKMKEGVGMFPETQHNYSMCNRNGCKGGMRGYRKEGKSITTKQAISMWEHECWLDEQDAIADYEEAERLFMMDEMASLMEDVCWFDNQIDYERSHLAYLMERVNELAASIASMNNRRYDCLKKIEKIQEDLNK